MTLIKCDPASGNFINRRLDLEQDRHSQPGHVPEQGSAQSHTTAGSRDSQVLNVTAFLKHPIGYEAHKSAIIYSAQQVKAVFLINQRHFLIPVTALTSGKILKV